MDELVVRVGIQQRSVAVPVEPAARELYVPSATHTLSQAEEHDGVVFFTTALVELTGRLDFDLFARCSEELGLEIRPRWWFFDRPIFAGLVSKTGDPVRNHRLEVLPRRQWEHFFEWFRNMAVYSRELDYFRRFAWGEVLIPERRGEPQTGKKPIAYAQVATNRGCFLMSEGEVGCLPCARFQSEVPPEVQEFATRLRGGVSDLYGVEAGLDTQ